MKKKHLILSLICVIIIPIALYAFNYWENFIVYNYVTPDYELKSLLDFYVDSSKFNKEDYNNLVKDLDKDSKYTVDKILSDTFVIMNATANNQPAYVITGKEFLENLKYAFYGKNRAKLNRDKKVVYKFDNYIFEISPDIHVFYNKYGINKYVKNKNLIKNRDIIDAGAYIGDSSLALSEFTNKKVYAFEPVPDIYAKLLKTLSLNNNKQVVPVMMGLGDKSETNLINHQLDIDSTSSLKYNFNDTKNTKKEEIKLTTIDDFVKTNNLEIGLIKSDIEGYESELLKGAEKTIKTQKPVLIISIYHSADDFFHIKGMIEKWNLGYKFKIVKLNPDKRLYETVLIAEIK